MRVLLIEDDPMIGRAVVAGLQDAGYTVDWVRDGAEGGRAPGPRPPGHPPPRPRPPPGARGPPPGGAPGTRWTGSATAPSPSLRSATASTTSRSSTSACRGATAST